MQDQPTRHPAPSVRHRLHFGWRPMVLATALALGLPLASTPAWSQTTSRHAAQSPQISGFVVQQADRLEPGADLSFTVWGTPGAAATLDIQGATRKVTLQETRRIGISNASRNPDAGAEVGPEGSDWAIEPPRGAQRALLDALLCAHPAWIRGPARGLTLVR